MRAAFVVDSVRTPIGKYRGALSGVRPDDMAAHVIRDLLVRQGSVDSAAIDDVLLGCANQAGEDNRNVARMAALLAGLPASVPGETVNRLCASGMSAVVQSARAIQTGAGALYIAGGVESMTRAPYVLSKDGVPFGRAAEMFDTTIGWRFKNPALEKLYGTDSMGETAENVAERYRVSREDQDAFAANSQAKCSVALKGGRFEREISAILAPAGKNKISVEVDEFPRPDTTAEVLSGLRAAFRANGSVTAGNSSGINDGACAVLLASEEAVSQFQLKPRARYVSSAVVGVEPALMGIGPVNATKKVLSAAGLQLNEIDVIELNEAFAVQSVACLRELGLQENDERVNPNGGAIALGHPLGMSGARLIQTAVEELHEQGKRYALCTMCVGVGQGMAMILERV